MSSPELNKHPESKTSCEQIGLRNLLEVSCPETLERLSRPYVFPKGVELFQQGFAPNYVYYLEAGLIKLIFDTEDGHEVIIKLAKPGCILGAPEAILDALCTVSGVTVQRCRLRCISIAGFVEALAADPQFGLFINRTLSQELSDAFIHSAELAVSDARSRLEQLLWNLVSSVERVEEQHFARVQLPITHEEIAQLIAVTPQYLSCLLKQLTEEGVLRKVKGSLIVIDPRVLRH